MKTFDYTNELNVFYVEKDKFGLNTITVANNARLKHPVVSGFPLKGWGGSHEKNKNFRHIC